MPAVGCRGPDARSRLFVEQWRHLPAEYVILIYHYAQQPKESVLNNLRLFMDEVKPALDELTDYPKVRQVAE